MPVGPSQLRLLHFATSVSTDDRALAPWSSTHGRSVRGSRVRDALREAFPLHSMVPNRTSRARTRFDGGDNTSGSTVATPSRPDLSSGPCTPTAKRSTSTRCRILRLQRRRTTGRRQGYIDRSDVRAGMAEVGGVLNDAFASVAGSGEEMERITGLPALLLDGVEKVLPLLARSRDRHRHRATLVAVGQRARTPTKRAGVQRRR